MESSVTFRAFQYSSGLSTHSAERIGLLPVGNTIRSNFVSFSGFLSACQFNRTRSSTLLASCVETDAPPKNNKPSENNASRSPTFPDVFQSLVEEVCDDTDIAELKLKIGEFEVHLKRNIVNESADTPLSSTSQTAPSPVPVRPVQASATVQAATSIPKSSGKFNPFINENFGNSTRLAALEASGITGYSVVSSPMVGTFKASRPGKGDTKQLPIINEGDLIRKGAVIGYMFQFGLLKPIKSDVTGEVLELLVHDGEAVGFGDPLLAVLPS